MVSDERVETYHASRTDLNRIRAYKVIFNKHSSAAEAALRCEAYGDASDLVAALVSDRGCVSVEILDIRSDALEGDETSIQIARDGKAIGPFLDTGGWAVIFVIDREPIKMSSREFAESRRILFNRIIDNKIRAASVTWYWGDTQRLVNQTAGVDDSECDHHKDLRE
jgi:hypothetical protein